jgi:uncharacterized protein YprB with RNaseH-like and TPR domain
MLENTFMHIQGIGPKTEIQLWGSGITDWHSFMQANVSGLSRAKAALMRDHIAESQKHLAMDPAYFAARLPANQHWRLFPHFRDGIAYVDIETTGLDGFTNQITTIALYDGKSVSYYVHGENLEDFLDDIIKYKVLVTYNGKCFDVPFIERYFGISLTQVHIDLRYILHSLGCRGGLKGCEKQLGVDRGDLNGVDGYFAVLLWNEYVYTGDRDILHTLLAYNMLDTVNLEILMVQAYNQQVAKTPFAGVLRLPDPPDVPLPVKPSIQIVDRIKRKYLGWI